MDNLIPFLATPGGKSHAILSAFGNERHAGQTARRAYLKSLESQGIENLWGTGESIVGFVVRKITHPKHGWRISKRDTPDDEAMMVIVPDVKTQAGKDAKAELEKLPKVPGAHELARDFGFGGFCCGDGHIYWAYYEILSEQHVVLIPKMGPKDTQFIGSEAGQFIPPDCVEMKLSEYHRLKEEREAKAEPASATV